MTDQSLTDDESDSMSDSQESNESDSSQKSSDDEDDIDWERIRDEAMGRHINKLEALVRHYEQEGESHETAEAIRQKMIYFQLTEKSFVKYCLSILNGCMT